MRKVIQLALQDEMSRRGLGFALFFLFINLALLGLFWFRLPPQVPLFYSHPWGEEQLANPYFLFIFPASILLISVANLIVTSFSEEQFLKRTLILTSSLYAFLSLFALARILFIVF